MVDEYKPEYASLRECLRGQPTKMDIFIQALVEQQERQVKEAQFI